MSLRLGDLGGGQTRTWARPAGRRSPREKNSGLGTRDLILGTCRAAAGTDGPGRGAPQTQ